MVGLVNKEGYYYPKCTIKAINNNTLLDNVSSYEMNENTDLYFFYDFSNLKNYEEVKEIKLNFSYKMDYVENLVLQLKELTTTNESFSSTNISETGEILNPDFEINLNKSNTLFTIDISTFARKMILSDSKILKFRVRLVNPNKNYYLKFNDLTNFITGLISKKSNLVQEIKLYNEKTSMFDYNENKMLLKIKPLDVNYKGLSLTANSYLVLDQNLNLLEQNIFNLNLKFYELNNQTDKIELYSELDTPIIFYLIDKQNNKYKCFENDYTITLDTSNNTFILNTNGINYLINLQTKKITQVQKDNIILNYLYNESNNLVSIVHQISNTKTQEIVSIYYYDNNIYSVKYLYHQKELCFRYEDNKLIKYFICDTKNIENTDITTYTEQFEFNENKLCSITYDHQYKYNLTVNINNGNKYLVVENDKTKDYISYSNKTFYLEEKDNYNNVIKSYFNFNNEIIYIEKLNKNNKLLSQVINTNSNIGTNQKNLLDKNFYNQENIRNIYKSSQTISDYLYTYNDSYLSGSGYKFSSSQSLFERNINVFLNINYDANDMLSISCIGKNIITSDKESLKLGCTLYYDTIDFSNNQNNGLIDNITEEFHEVSFKKENSDYQFVEILVPVKYKCSNMDLTFKYMGLNEAEISNIYINKVENKGNLVYDENNQIVGVSNNDDTISSSVKYDEDKCEIYLTSKTENGNYQTQTIKNGNLTESKNNINNDCTRYEYTDNVLSKKTTVNNSYKSIENYSYNDKDEITSKSKDDKTEYYFNENKGKLILSQTINANGLLSKTITDYSSTSKNYTSVFTLNDLKEKNKFIYLDGLLYKIENFDKKIYEFAYDSKNRIQKIYFDDVLYIEYQYDDNDIELMICKKYQDNNYYTFSYDNYGRLEYVYYKDNNNPIYTYSYDNYNKITSIKNVNGETEYLYEYDDNNNLVKENNKNITINYDYNNKELVSKHYNFKSSNEVFAQTNINFEEKIEDIFSNLTNNIYCDYLYPTSNQSFLYSERKDFDNELLYDEHLKRNYYRIKNPNNLLKVALKDINKRIDNNVYRNEKFTYLDYENLTSKKLNMLIFIRLSGNYVKEIFSFSEYQGTENEMSKVAIEVSSSNELLFKSYVEKTLVQTQRTGLYINKNEWNIVGLTCSYDLINDEVTVFLNDKEYKVAPVGFNVYDSIQLLDKTASNVDVAFLTVGYRDIKENEMKLLYNDFNKVFNKQYNNKMYNVTNYEIFDSSQLDKVTFNNTLNTIKGYKPLLAYINPSYLNSNNSIFKYDEEINKYCYISNTYKDSYLRYSFNKILNKNLYLCVKVKPLLYKSTYNTLCSITDEENNEKLIIRYCHPLINIKYIADEVDDKGKNIEYTESIDVSLSKDKFNTFKFIINEDESQIAINDQEFTLPKFEFISNNLNLVIGNDKNNNSFDGLFSDLIFGYTSQNNILNKQIDFINISDKQGRLRNKIINQNNNPIETTYSYYDTPNDDGTKKLNPLVNRIKNYDNSEEIISYDDNDSIIKRVLIKDNIITKITNYTYDSFNRLIEEIRYETSSSNTLEETYKGIYEYDSFGNIVKREKYINKILQNNITYEYTIDNTNRLSVINNNNISTSINYNNSLYPTQIGNNIIEYEGKKIIKYGNTSFTYDSLGKRISKTITNNGITKVYNYIYDNDNLVRQISNNITIDYIYNNTLLEGLRYNNEEYYYVRDITGSIEKIIDKNKKEMVLYTYTSYGEVESKINPSLTTSEQTIANILMNNNGFVYKGYYYDVETNLFLVSSRYYSPELCRWISPDDIEYLDPESVNGLNLYCYCFNDPINYIDPDGHFPILALVLTGIALVGMGLTGIGVATDNNVLTAVGLGMVGAAALVSGIGALASGVLFTGVVGGITTAAGVGSLTFMSAEITEAAGAGNWIQDVTGWSDSTYNTILLSTAAVATLGTAASSFASYYKVSGIRKYDNYLGIKFQNSAGKTRVMSFHTHGHNGVKGLKSIKEWHWQLKKWDPRNLKTGGTVGRWAVWGLKKIIF